MRTEVPCPGRALALRATCASGTERTQVRSLMAAYSKIADVEQPSGGGQALDEHPPLVRRHRAPARDPKPTLESPLADAGRRVKGAAGPLTHLDTQPAVFGQHGLAVRGVALVGLRPRLVGVVRVAQGWPSSAPRARSIGAFLNAIDAALTASPVIGPCIPPLHGQSRLAQTLGKTIRVLLP